MPLRLAFSRYPAYRFEEVTSQRARPILAPSAILSMSRAGIARHSGSRLSQLSFRPIRPHVEQTKSAWVDLSSGAVLEELCF
jgi:hypothetical protein